MERFKRQSLRIKNYNYSRPGFYFITLCTWDRGYYLGRIKNNLIKLSPIGKIVQHEWFKTPQLRQNIKLGEFIIMPNHIHGIIQIKYQILRLGNQLLRSDTQKCRGVLQYAPTNFVSPSQTVGAIMRGFKAATTTKINQKFNLKYSIWQRNYYEVIIKNQQQLKNINNYIQNNPANWQQDKFY